MTHAERGKPPPNVEGEVLVRRIAEGKQDALELLIARYASRLGAYILRIAGEIATPSDVEEVVADCFLKVWQTASSYDSQRGPVEAWLLHLARYEALSLRRRKHQRSHESVVTQDSFAQVPDTISPSVEQTVDRLVTHDQLQAALAELPERDQAIIRQYYYENHTAQQIATALGMSVSAINVRLFRIRRRLRGDLEQNRLDENLYNETR